MGWGRKGLGGVWDVSTRLLVDEMGVGSVGKWVVVGV
jgi:hypothetical protein